MLAVAVADCPIAGSIELDDEAPAAEDDTLADAAGVAAAGDVDAGRMAMLAIGRGLSSSEIGLEGTAAATPTPPPPCFASEFMVTAVSEGRNDGENREYVAFQRDRRVAMFGHISFIVPDQSRHLEQ